MEWEEFFPATSRGLRRALASSASISSCSEPLLRGGPVRAAGVPEVLADEPCADVLTRRERVKNWPAEPLDEPGRGADGAVPAWPAPVLLLIVFRDNNDRPVGGQRSEDLQEDLDPSRVGGAPDRGDAQHLQDQGVGEALGHQDRSAGPGDHPRELDRSWRLV